LTTPFRPVLRYLGGKWRIAPWIVSHFPPHQTYVEPFGGAASVLLRKDRSMGECYNDLDSTVVNLFRVLQNREMAAELARLVALTPFAREEYDRAFEPTDDPVESARRLIARSYMGHGSSSAVSTISTGFRAGLVNRGGALPAREWLTMPAALAAVTDRMSGVLIENRPALALVERYDEEGALFYIDPPYLPETRSQKRKGERAFHAYACEMTPAEHEELLARILTMKSMVVLSGYANPMYDEALAGWRRETKETHANGNLDRLEVLWCNPAATERGRSLFT